MVEEPNNVIMLIQTLENQIDGAADTLSKIVPNPKQTKARITKAKITHNLYDVIQEQIPQLMMDLGYVGTKG